jgi:SAM-dependent methyltransferase
MIEPASSSVANETEVRERDFWDHHIPSLDEALQLFRSGIDVQTQTLLYRLEPLAGRRVLDFACGAGALSALLSARGARVVGVDISPASIKRAEELADALALDIEFRVTELDVGPLGDDEPFDILVGRFALHHLDLDRYFPLLTAALRPGGSAGFIETMATNPLLQFARQHVVGRLGVTRLGTTDEHPLTRRDIRNMQHHFGPVEVVVPQVDFLKLASRQGIEGHPRLDRAFQAADGWFGRWPRLGFLSYHQILLATKR